MRSAAAGSCPRISPPGFRVVCTFTYARPASIAAKAAAGSGASPRAPLRQGPQRATATGPGLPLLAMWMCAATALPVSRANVSRQVTVPVAPSVATVETNDPVARADAPLGFGTSCLALSVGAHRRSDTDLTAHLTGPVQCRYGRSRTRRPSVSRRAPRHPRWRYRSRGSCRGRGAERRPAPADRAPPHGYGRPWPGW